MRASEVKDKAFLKPTYKIEVTCDTMLREAIGAQIKDNGGYCPCRIEKTKDTMCICKEFREQDSGWCHCGLYHKIEKESVDI